MGLGNVEKAGPRWPCFRKTFQMLPARVARAPVSHAGKSGVASSREMLSLGTCSWALPHFGPAFSGFRWKLQMTDQLISC